MPRGKELSIVDLELERLKEWKKYYENAIEYVRKMKEIVRKRDKDAQVLIFGSYVKGNMKPNSDIDVLIITKLAENIWDRVKLRVEIAKEIGDYTPFEIHIVTPSEYENWYKKFIDKYIEV